ncbi:NADH-quinone oxidoreductase subunit N [Desulfoglaeba alkanexedens]|uniref:NADH-quinone oxidoreductase subunit N n=1 Tax=Desulfoglaeba alkanexedens ALDC TaxID=980445 RepID=A0A4P8KZE1_9BACT|nr:NADH-quinone oxidoreductase subunit N [Desulfoglaeba alkanexedens]QCQ20917.1 NADH-quinone oxidoreductase subunit N [Desulfoglaeba alkanexedens ALDC]
MDGLKYLAECAGVLPFLIVVGTGIVILLVDAFSPLGRKGHPAYLACVGTVLALAALFRPLPLENELFGGMIYADAFAVFFNAVFLLGTLLVVLLSVGVLSWERIERGEYYALLLFSTAGMMLMAQAANLVMLFLGLEIFSIAIYVLVGMPRHQRRANEASLKYFLLGAFASGFFVYGLTFLYGAVGSLSMSAMAAYLGTTQTLFNAYLLLGSALVLVGFSFKIALVPFHMWTPDVYEGAATPVTAYMAVGVKAAVFAALARVFWLALPTIRPHWIPVFWVLSALTMTVGNVMALTQQNVKRMLAYSSIAHAGTILMAVTAASDQGLTGMLVYLLAYTFMNLGAFGVVIYLQERYGVGEALEDLRGLGFQSPLLGAAMAVFLFSLAGIPPTAGFIAKFFVFAAAVRADLLWLVIIGVLNSVVAVYYYLRVVVVMYSRSAESGWHPAISESPAGSVAAAGALVLALWATLHLGIFPHAFWEWARQSVYVLL